MRQRFLRLHVVAAMLVTVLAAGRGLPGLVRAASGASSHVCTCASGGSHAACAVCNPSLVAYSPARRSTHPVFDAAPCGEHRVGEGIGTGGLSSTLPPARVDVAPPARRLLSFRAETAAPPLEFIEPRTPPPRNATT